MKQGMGCAMVVACYGCLASAFDTAAAATTYQYTAVITESNYGPHGDTPSPIIPGEIDRDGWRVGDTIKATFYYDPVFVQGYSQSKLIVQIGDETIEFNDDAPYGPVASSSPTYGDEIVYLELHTGPFEEGSLSIRFEDRTGSVLPAPGVLPDQLNLADFTSVEINYALYDLTPDYWSVESIRAVVVPLPPAVWLLGTGLLTLVGCVKRRAAS